ncbi:MAG: flagellar hook-length control protein FliK, partial [Caballeronia sp.]|nr:flagellar hook-length control protein FliK [Caballeronia sp.]
ASTTQQAGATSTAQQADATALATATPADDGSAAYKATSDAVAHSASMQAASGSAGSAPVQSAATAAASAAIAPHVGTSGWDEAFSQKVVFLSNAHQQSAELTLNPKDLGPLQVVLQVTDNHAHALFVSTHAQVRAAVEAALPTLREAMQGSGISLGSTSVSDGFVGQQPGQQGDGASSNAGRGGRGMGGADDAGNLDALSTISMPVRRQVGLVDTFA